LAKVARLQIEHPFYIGGTELSDMVRTVTGKRSRLPAAVHIPKHHRQRPGGYDHAGFWVGLRFVAGLFFAKLT
jgi:hypothetical protein